VTEPRTTVPVGLTQEGTPSGTLPAATTPAPVAVATETVPAETPTPIPVPPGKALIPAGFFQMGSAVGGADEAPEHPVLMPAFYLDLTEVTNAMYRQCVGSGACTPSGSARQNNSTFDNYPVVQVIWGQADTYCRSVGGRLPTEAEWEYAAGGPENLTWPWGNTFDPLLSAASRGDVQPVGSFAGGASPFKVLDMAGNANEWVADAYSTTFYAASPASSPLNSQGGEHRQLRQQRWKLLHHQPALPRPSRLQRRRHRVPLRAGRRAGQRDHPAGSAQGAGGRVLRPVRGIQTRRGLPLILCPIPDSAEAGPAGIIPVRDLLGRGTY
jgi:formylglycine-generating enzyme required for sulfatase activity